MSLTFFIQSACLVSLLVSVTLIHAQQKVFDVTNYGARGDGTTDNSKAFTDAWNGACQNDGGGMVLFPQGNFMVAPVVLSGKGCKGAIELRIQGTLLASRKTSDFVGVNHWITLQQTNGLTISGGGTLDGIGADGWPYNDCQQHPGHCPTLPTTLRLDSANQGHIDNITSLNSKNVHINLFACTDVLVSNVKILAPGDSPNTDGIHIGGSTNINIVNTNISTGDDCISVSPRSQFINVTGVQCGPGHGISIGSLGKNPNEWINNMYVSHCRFDGTQNGVRIKTWSNPNPGNVTRVRFEHVHMVNVSNPIIIDQEYCPSHQCGQQESSKIQISDVKFDEIRGSSASKEAVILKCSASVPCQDIGLRNIDLKNIGPGGPAVSVADNVRGSTSGIQRPPVSLKQPGSFFY